MKLKATITLYLIQHPNGNIKIALRPFENHYRILRQIDVDIQTEIDPFLGEKYSFDYRNMVMLEINQEE